MDRSILLEIRGLTNLIKREICKNKHHSFDNATEVHGYIVKYLVDNQNRDIFQRDFEEEFMMRRSTASRMLKLMENNDMIERIPVLDDARLKKIVLTEKAINMSNEMKLMGKAINVKMKKGLSDEELLNFFNVIDKIKKNMEEQ